MRKHILLSFFLLYLSVSTRAQNLLPNPSFEQYGTCPSALNQVNNSNITWYRFTNATPDYYNACAPSSGMGVPANLLGYQFASSGNGYIGLQTHTSTNHIEYVAAAIPALRPGARYKASMKVSLADNVNLAGNDLGMYFFRNGPAFLSTTGVINVAPQVSFNNYGKISNKSGWTTLTTTFMADSAYTSVVLGAFYNSTAMNVISAPPGTMNSAYYYIDEVSLKIDMRIQFLFKDTLFCANDSIRVNYVIDSPAYFNSSNHFDLQLSDKSGNFNNPVTIGSMFSTTSGTLRGLLPDTLSGGNNYRIRIVASSPMDTSLDNGMNITIKPVPAKPVGNSNAPVCSGDTLQLAATSATLGVSWNWKGPGNFNSNISNPVRINPGANHSGNYIVTAMLNGCLMKDTVAVIIKQSPGKITASANTPLCEGDTLRLQAANGIANVAFNWAGPANFSAQVSNPRMGNTSLAASGDYIATATLNGCSKMDTIKVQVKPTPYVTATTVINLCISKPIKLTATSTLTNANYVWNGPNGYVSQAQNPTVSNSTLLHSGAYIVTAKLNGCTASDTTFVTVYPIPNPTSATSNSPVCFNDTIKITSSASPNVTYAWTGPNNFTANTAKIYKNHASFADSGIYRLTVSNAGGCVRKDSLRLLIKPTPITTATNTSPICEGGSFNLNTTNTYTGTQFLWTGPNGFTSTARNTTISNAGAKASGAYTVRTSYNGCTFSSTTTVTVRSLPIAKAGSNMPICHGETLKLQANILPGATYHWKGPGGFTSTQSDPAVGIGSIALDGRYILKVTQNGCVSKPDTIAVKINPVPMIGAYASPGDTLCAGTKPTFVAFVQFAAPGSAYQWYRNHHPMQGVTGLVHLVQDPTDGDVLFCKLTATGVCSYPLDLNSDTIHMTVLPIVTQPVVKISAAPGLGVYPGQQIMFTASIQHGGINPKYQWYKNGQLMTGARYATWTTNDVRPGDKISVHIVSEDPCAEIKTATDTVTLVQPTAINNQLQAGAVSLYPNPNRGSFTIQGIKGNIADIEVINSIGQMIYHTSTTNTGGQVNIDMPFLPGSYVLRIKAGEEHYILKFTVLE